MIEVFKISEEFYQVIVLIHIILWWLFAGMDISALKLFRDWFSSV